MIVIPIFKHSETGKSNQGRKSPFSGNPVKWFQGHNIFGTSDLCNLVYELFDSLAKKFGKEQPEFIRDGIREGQYTISRIDINGMFELGSRLDVLSCVL